MVKKLFCVILIACSFIVLYAPTASAGIEPSPFKIYLVQTIQQIIQRVNIMTTSGTAGAGEIVARLEAIADPAKNVTNVRLAKNTLGAMDRITAVFFAPQPEPPKVIPPELVFLVQDALDALDELITLGFETPPEMISLATESSQLLDRFTARLFAPQPEPPRVASVESGLHIVSSISQLTLGTTPDDRTAVKMGIGHLSQVEAVLFAPQPEPPKIADILVDMSKLYFDISTIPGAN